MIRSQQQYQVTKHWAERFERDATALEASFVRELSPETRQLLIEAARSEAKILREQMAEWEKRFVTIHIVAEMGRPLCQFSNEVPGRWPFGHIWIRPHQYTENAAACADPDHVIHCIFPFRMCKGCEDATKGLTCKLCGQPLDPAHPAVCALRDA